MMQQRRDVLHGFYTHNATCRIDEKPYILCSTISNVSKICSLLKNIGSTKLQVGTGLILIILIMKKKLYRHRAQTENLTNIKKGSFNIWKRTDSWGFCAYTSNHK